MVYRIGTRGSKLALVQTEYVRNRLQKRYPQDIFEIRIIKTRGDMVTDRPLDQVGGSGLFVKEIERALLEGEIQLAVHSMKDMPCQLPEGLVLAPVWEREDPRDALVLREKKSLEELPESAVIGTGSKRRAVQLQKLRPDLRIVNLRGNVDTRLRKMEEQKLDGIILAAAGLKRLGLQDRITHFFEIDEMIPAPTQGTLAIELREDNRELLHKLAPFGDAKTELQTEIERAFLQEMGADCHLPIGAYAYVKDKNPISTMNGDGEYGDAKSLDGIKERKNFNQEITLYSVYGNSRCDKVCSVAQSGTLPADLVKYTADVIKEKIAGKVILLGAGPGEIGLLTQKGYNAIINAKCIIYDRLVSEKVLNMAPEDCEKCYVGKENHNHTLPQAQINELLVKKAMEYDVVVRLKGGDPYVFGRGGEEGLYLREHGIRCEVIPGISSALAGLAYAGIPITHRGISTGFHVVTAHSQRDELADIDFQAMAKGKDTCVFLMGLRELPQITSRLMEAGRAKDTPVAVISHGTTPRQKCCVGTLADIAGQVEKDGITSPALIVVGEVVALREKLNFWEERPGFGKKYLVAYTRHMDSYNLSGCTGRKWKASTQRSENELVEILEETGAQVNVVTCGKIVRIEHDFSKEELAQWDWLIFTSKNGVHSFFANLYQSGLDARVLGQLQIAVIGKATEKTLREYGVFADFIPKQADSKHFCEEFAGNINRDTRVLYIQNQEEKHPVTDMLADQCDLTELPLYRNELNGEALEISDEELLTYDRIYFTNAKSIERLLGERSRQRIAQMDEKKMFYVIGPACANKLRELGAQNIVVAGNSSYSSLGKA